MCDERTAPVVSSPVEPDRWHSRPAPPKPRWHPAATGARSVSLELDVFETHPPREGHMNDRTLCILLALALSLWTNFLLSRTAPAAAEQGRGYTLQSVYIRLLAVQSDLAELKREMAEVDSAVTEIKTGRCQNPKIC